MIMWAIKDTEYPGEHFWSLERTRSAAIKGFLTNYPPFNTWRGCRNRGFRAIKVNVEEIKP